MATIAASGAIGPEEAASTAWDVVVIGTGMGGATVGRRLAEAGHSVLFLERGRAEFTGEDVPGGQIEGVERRLDAALWPERLSVRVGNSEGDIFASLGCGVGGSTMLYAATLERFARSDVEPVDGLPHPTGGWPVSWEVMTGYYAEAERLFRVVGGPDPLDGTPVALPPPPAASPTDAELMRHLAEAGLHPYRLHVGFGYRPGCGECGGRRCHRRCKSDARLICIEPALATGRAALLADSEVLSLDADRQQVRAVAFKHGGRRYLARGRIVVLAAGAYHSPALLLRSANAYWPAGLANGSDLVGRNLMLHANEWVALWPRRRLPTAGPRKTIGLRDFLVKDGVRLGSLQSTGLSAGSGNIYASLLARFDRSRWRRLGILRPLLRVAARIAAVLLGEATIFVMLVEDLAYPDNRVMLNAAGGVRVHYDIRAELRERVLLARRLLRSSVAGLRAMPLQIDVQLNFGHPCGTCRFGNDPATSVLDPDCKAHELDNLYVVDASFMPSSGGANPALTIAANALRVGDAMSRRLNAARAAAAEGVP